MPGTRKGPSLTALLAGLLISAAAAAPDGHDSRRSVDWTGTYRGVLPCADCAGIATEVTLRADGRYRRRQHYRGERAEPVVETGRFRWDDDGGVVALGEGPARPRYRVGENVLFHLDRNGERIEGDLAARYRLDKLLTDPRLEGRRWMATALLGAAVAADGRQPPPALRFDAGSGRVSGSDGCNRLFGPYYLHAGGRLAFGDLAGTLMACPDMERPQRFRRVLARVDHYRIDDGVLLLLAGDAQTLARLRSASQRPPGRPAK